LQLECSWPCKEECALPMHEEKILILGTGSLLWPYLSNALQCSGTTGFCCGRQPPKMLPEGYAWISDHNAVDSTLKNYRVISLLPLWLLPGEMHTLRNCRQLIAFSTTSIFTKGNSQDREERMVASRILEAETAILKVARQAGFDWTILRPTLIYGAGRDRNITAVADFIHRWRFFPVAWPGKGGRQPVHAADLATAAMACLDNPSARNTSFNLAGGEVLTYREMVRRVFRAMGRPVRILMLPAYLPALALRLARKPTEFSPALFRRMNEDLVFDQSAAATALGYQPRPFLPELPARLCSPTRS
jgi:hypothetical protein